MSDDRSVIRAAADSLVAYHHKPWFYGDSVGFEALVRASVVLDDPRYEGFCHGVARGAFARDPEARPMDNTIPGRALVQMAVRRTDALLLDGLVRLHDALALRPRLGGAPVSLQESHLVVPYGGVGLPSREVRLLSDPGPGVYVDCLHFDPPFTTALGVALDDGALIDAGQAMAESFTDLLVDPATGLFHHFYLERTGRAHTLGWSRGQGWALLGLLDVIEDLGRVGRRAEHLEAAVTECLGALRERQRPDGDWGAIVVREDSPAEASAAAFTVVAAYRAKRLGVVGDEFDGMARLGEAAVRGHVDHQGRLGGVSAVVWSSTNPEHYDHVSMGHLVPWGQGPLILVLDELARTGEGART